MKVSQLFVRLSRVFQVDNQEEWQIHLIVQNRKVRVRAQEAIYIGAEDTGLKNIF
jgi:hypothetical protein